MDYKPLLDLLKDGTFWTAVGALASAAATAGLLWQIFELRMQLRRNFHLEYARRYIEIIRGIPSRAFEEDNFSLADCLKEKPDFKVTARLYFWLVQEEYALHKKRLLPDKQWSIWEQEFFNMIKQKCFRDVWRELEKKVAYPKEFVDFVNEILSRQQNRVHE